MGKSATATIRDGILKQIARSEEGRSFKSIASILRGESVTEGLTLQPAEIKKAKIKPAPIRQKGITFSKLQEEVRELAYYKWEKACQNGGNTSQESCWNCAEEEIFGPDALKDGGYYVYVEQDNGSIKLELIKN